MKTNKSFTKRLRVTRNGKVLARKPGQNHFRSRYSRGTKLARKGTTNVAMTSALRGRFLPRTNQG